MASRNGRAIASPPAPRRTERRLMRFFEVIMARAVLWLRERSIEEVVGLGERQEETLHVALGGLEGAAQGGMRASVFSLLEAPFRDVEPLSDVTIACVVALGDLVCQLDGSVEVASLVSAGHIAAVVNGLAVVEILPKPDAVVVLETETDGVEPRVARDAGRVGTMGQEALARGARGIHRGFLDHEARRRIRDLAAENLGEYELAAHDRVVVASRCRCREQACLREQAGAPRLVEIDPLKGTSRDTRHAVELRERTVKERKGAREHRGEVAGSVPDDVD